MKGKKSKFVSVRTPVFKSSRCLEFFRSNRCQEFFRSSRCLEFFRSNRCLEFVMDCLYPPRCAVCDTILRSSKERCCPDCRKKLPWTAGPVCMKCGKPITDGRREYCPDCSRHSHYFDQGAAAFTYTDELRHSVYRMKAENRRDYLDFYAEAMAAVVAGRQERWQPDVMIPVPMHKSRRRKRGYNQSELLARKISRLTGIVCDWDAVACVRRTKQQKTLGREQRLQNLKGSFAVKRTFPPGTRVLIVDDVYTTGSTMDEMARVLKEAGAEAVFFVVLCTGKGKKTVCTAENMCYT